MFQFLIGRLITDSRPGYSSITKKAFQFLIGRLITYDLQYTYHLYTQFQFLIGRLITSIIHLAPGVLDYVSIPHR